MRNVLKRVKNQFSDYCDLYFVVINYFILNSQVFSTDQKKIGHLKDAQCSESDFCIREFFFVRFLVFQIWSILYTTAVYS